MTDIQYIVGFRNNVQRVISHFYTIHRDAFFRDIGRFYRISDTDLLSEIYQESVVRLWKNVLSGRLTEQNLTTALAGYLYSVGRLVAMEVFRREGVSVKKNLSEDEIVRLKADTVADVWLGRETAQEVAVRESVYAMGDPCASLLLLFYWDKLSWEAIAKQLRYKDASSAKSQKYKCIQKLKAQFL